MYDAVITVTVNYRTSPDTRAVVRPRLAPSTCWNAVTLRRLTGATTYDLTVGVSPVNPPAGTTFVESADVLVTVEAAPA